MTRARLRLCCLVLTALAAATPALAQTPGAPWRADSGDTAWMLTSTALVLMMTVPGLALFYGGMVRRKNVIGTVAQSFAITCLVTVLWMLGGYSIAFSPGITPAMGEVIGGVGRVMLAGVKVDGPSALAGSIPEYVFLMFQMSFAIITPALIAGAFAERMKFSALVLFTTLWSLLVYAPVAHWVWGGGFLAGWGVLDFAGGTVVHVNAGVAGLVCALVMGPRKGFGHDNMAPHNLVLTLVGASLLWVGWFGFNGGSALASNGLAGLAVANTQIAAGAAGISWTALEWIERKKPTLLGVCSGAVGGLVAITPAAGFVNPQGALLIGLAAGLGCYGGAVWLKRRMGYDDSLDAFGVHGIGGIIGALLTGVLADAAVNPMGKDHSILAQAAGVAVTAAWSGLATFLILMVCRFTTGLALTGEQQTEGMDYVLHGEVLHE